MSFFNQQGEYYSNCLIEAAKAKLRYGKEIRIIYIPPSKNDVYCPHFMWHDLIDDNIKDFHNAKWVKSGCNELFFLGNIRIRPYEVYEKWLKTKKWG